MLLNKKHIFPYKLGECGALRPGRAGRIADNSIPDSQINKALCQKNFKAGYLVLAMESADEAPARGHWPEFDDGGCGKTVLEADASVLSIRGGA